MEIDSKVLKEAERLALEAKNAVETEYWIDGEWRNCSTEAIKKLYHQLAGIQLLLIRSGAGDSESCRIVTNQIKCFAKILESNPS